MSLLSSIVNISVDDKKHIPSKSEELIFFISHKDKHKVEARKLADKLEVYNISCFVSHDTIEPMSDWKEEILKYLNKADAFICYITKDFYKSIWTNQEIGFALARDIPIYLYSVDGTNPKGFKLDIQAIRNYHDLIKCMKEDFLNNPKFRKGFIEAFVESRNTGFATAKSRFFDIVDFQFNDKEIEQIGEAFISTNCKYSINQLSVLISDSIETQHQDHPRLQGYEYYRDYIKNEIFNKHSKNLYSIKIPKDDFEYEVVKNEN